MEPEERPSEEISDDPNSSHRQFDEKQCPKRRKTGKRTLEEALINFINTPPQIPQPQQVDINPDRAFFESLLPSVSLFTEDQKLEFRCEVLSTIKRIRLGAVPTPPAYQQYQQHHPPPTFLPQTPMYHHQPTFASSATITSNSIFPSTFFHFGVSN
ncbi:uncharacterized protein LOC108740807 [Agrilus planipennis]|uniref:Uncharacterized protein LOC108740807 n=1 Tax=Agrilus planipennis TaxID=224129 RepID=A0A1W4XEB7_AGRPL|nr:uncharacterized protein LOC108740807 [Agrilus planipennis]